MAGKGILFDDNGDIKISNKSMLIGDSEMQETAVIIEMSQGQQKNVPQLGPDLIQMMKAKRSRPEIERRLKIHLSIDGKNYDAIKNKIQTDLR